jgi:nanoRNase/pAp phosphatase (c-di-AMP/oligoRNAs hydrolase)
MAGSLIIVSEHPERFSRLRLPDREIFRWRPDGKLEGEPHEAFQGPLDAAATYRGVARSAGDDVMAVLDLADPRYAAAVAAALREAKPDAALLVVCDAQAPVFPRDATVRCVSWPDLLREELTAELRRLELRRRVARIRRFAAGARVLPLLMQDDPDPDGMASALALRALLHRRAADSPIISLGAVSRPENQRMAELLRLQVTTVTAEELGRFDRVIGVDMQPTLIEVVPPRLAVIDHHPPRPGWSAELVDIRPEYGAVSTMLTEYLRADDERRIRTRVATALLYGIKTDTASLSRGASAADAAAYAFLQERADAELLYRIERPAYQPDLARDLGEALHTMAVDGDVVAATTRPRREEELHVLADLADFLLGVEGVRWAAAAAQVEGSLVVKIRHTGGDPGAGELARRLAPTEGAGGGHASMGQAVLRPEEAADLWPALANEPARAARELAHRMRTIAEQLHGESTRRGRGKNRNAVQGPAVEEA